MRIAIIHSYYSTRQPSGENVVVDVQAAALRAAGHNVQVISQHTDELESGRGYAIRAAWNVATGDGPSPMLALEKFQPDVVHVHNLFPNWGTRWLKEWSGPLVATMHNFRPVCATGTLYRGGATCTLCPDHSSLNAVKHSCYRGSAVASLPLAIRNFGGAARDAVLDRADRVITLSERARALYSGFGVPSEKIAIIPNFVDDDGFEPDTAPGLAWAYIGRLTDEKGVRSLLAHWPVDEYLDVYGDGPLRPEVEAAGANIRYRGAIPRSEVAGALARSQGLVFPSEWAEGLPTIYVEALAAGRAIVARSGNSAADDVAVSHSGTVYERSAEIGPALSGARSGAREMGRHARARFESVFTRDAWLDRITDEYESMQRAATNA